MIREPFKDRVIGVFGDFHLCIHSLGHTGLHATVQTVLAEGKEARWASALLREDVLGEMFHGKVYSIAKSAHWKGPFIRKVLFIGKVYSLEKFVH